MKQAIYYPQKYNMKYFDHHTHKNKEHSLRSCTIDELQNISGTICGQKLSLQLHPWHLPEKYTGLPDNFTNQARSDSVYAIGEIGLDRLKGPDLEIQKAFFIDLLELAESTQKPVILHIVRCADEALKILSKYPDVKKIWHGFRGKTELFERIINANIFVSLHHSMLENQDFIDYIKTHKKYSEKIGFESDDNDIDIESLYQNFEAKING